MKTKRKAAKRSGSSAKRTKKSGSRKRRATRTRRRRALRSSRNGGALGRAIRSFLPEAIFANLAKHGNLKWTHFALASAAILWSWAGERTLGERHHLAREILERWLPGRFVATTYQGFIGALESYNDRMLAVVVPQLQAATRALAEQFGRWKLAGFAAFAGDGSKLATCWTAANEAELGKQGLEPKGKKCRRRETDLRPQESLTMVRHMGTGLPWAWRRSGPDQGERTHLRTMLDELPERALLVADAGFTGYELWTAIMKAKCDFLIRVGGNVELLTGLAPEHERRDDLVWLWPAGKRAEGAPPLKLRLIELKSGKLSVFLATTVLDPSELTLEQASTLYKARWGIEGQFRSLKQTFERSKLRSCTPAAAGCERDWSLAPLWLLGLTATREQLSAKVRVGRQSVAACLKVVRRELRAQWSGLEWLQWSDFASAVTDECKRTSSKKARHNARKKNDPPPGNPKIVAATSAERKAAKTLCVAA